MAKLGNHLDKKSPKKFINHRARGKKKIVMVG